MVDFKEIKAAMVREGFKQETLAEAIGMSHNTMNAKLNGRTKMYVDEAVAICNVLKIPDAKKIEIFLR